MYDGSHLYDLGSHIDSARLRGRALSLRREATQLKAESEYWRLFNSGATYREVTYGYGIPTRGKPVGRVVSVTADAEKLRKHEARFADTAKKLRRRSTPNLKGQVLELHSRGVVPAAIADTLNVADRRVREIIRAAA